MSAVAPSNAQRQIRHAAVLVLWQRHSFEPSDGNRAEELGSTANTSHRVITDASVRRFRCQRAYLRALAALRWVNGRNAILQGRTQLSGHTAQLQALDLQLRTVS